MFFQVEEHTCGPVALMNLVSWLGGLPDFSEMYLACKSDQDGTDDDQFLRVLAALKRKYSFKYETSKTVPAEQLFSFLKFSCNSALIAHLDNHGDWHWSFWHSAQDDLVMADNVEWQVLADAITREQAVSYLRRGSRDQKLVVMIQAQEHSEIHSVTRLPAEYTKSDGKSLTLDYGRNYAVDPLVKSKG
jgi:hypothetical protein